MGTKAGFGLKMLQWFVRGVQFLCAALILGVYSYFLATLHNHGISSTTQVRAVEGISGAAALYTLLALLLLCCVAGLTFTSFLAIILDICFIGCFIYVAVANRHGAGSCNGYLDTPFGRGQASEQAAGNRDGFTHLPSYRTACRLQSACLAVSIVAIIFFILSILMEVALARHHRKEKRFGPGPNNNYTSGEGQRAPGFFARVFRRKSTVKPNYDDQLPAHTLPGQVDGRQSYAGTETTAVNADNRWSGANYKAEPHTGTVPPLASQPPAGNYRYNDGVYDRA